jgi:single-strand DNA-binding protein
MAGSVNKVILIGNLGKDPEVKNLEGNLKVAKFPLATSETYKDRNGEKVTQTEWHNVTVWRGLADIAESYLKKGSSVYIEGKLKTRSWEQDGTKRYATDIVADNLTLLGSRGDRDDNGSVAAPSADLNVSDSANDDLPF